MFRFTNFKSTPSYNNLTTFIGTLSEPKDLSGEPILNRDFISYLLSIHNQIVKTPLSKEKGRFANPACLKIFNFISEIERVEYSFEELRDFVGLPCTFENKKLVPEVLEYLQLSFGNSERQDFGTGHELHFYCALYILYLGEYSTCSLYTAIRLYLKVSGHFILKYNLEAAGSKGVWGVDDYFILSFIPGLSELKGIKYFGEYLSSLKSEDILGLLLKFICKYKKDEEWKEMEGRSPFLFGLRQESPQSAKEKIMARVESDLFGSVVVMQHFHYTEYLSK